MVMRTPGRRYFETHWHIRLAGFIVTLMIASSILFLYGRINQLKRPHNPHYESVHCFDCHDSQGSKMSASDCFDCHDNLTRELLPGAVEKRLALSANKPCYHPIKLMDRQSQRTSTQLCLSCHDAFSGYVAMTNISDGTYIELSIARSHPIGLMPTETIYPRTLHLSRITGAIDCVTCHDPHGIDPRMKLLRYYHPGNGHPADFRPLCNDCHPDGWMPLKLKINDVVRPLKK